MLAQHSPHPRSLWVGLKGGVGFSTYTFSPSVPQTLQRGYTSGLVLRYEIDRGASAQVEVNYLRTGWTERFDTADQAYSRHFTYVEVPLLSHLYLGDSFRFFVNIGPVVGLNLGETSSVRGEGFTDAQLLRQATPIKHKYLWGLVGGPGVSFALGSRHRIEAEGRLTYSFTDIWDNKRADPYGQSSEIRIGVVLSYLFRF